MILANIHPYRIVLILILSYPRILCLYINTGNQGNQGKFCFLHNNGWGNCNSYVFKAQGGKGKKG